MDPVEELVDAPPSQRLDGTALAPPLPLSDGRGVVAAASAQQYLGADVALRRRLDDRRHFSAPADAALGERVIPKAQRSRPGPRIGLLRSKRSRNPSRRTKSLTRMPVGMAYPSAGVSARTPTDRGEQRHGSDEARCRPRTSRRTQPPGHAGGSRRGPDTARPRRTSGPVTPAAGRAAGGIARRQGRGRPGPHR